jgi:hypothetical protein
MQELARTGVVEGIAASLREPGLRISLRRWASMNAGVLMSVNSDLRIADEVGKTDRGNSGNGCKWMREKVENSLQIVVTGFWLPNGS